MQLTEAMKAELLAYAKANPGKMAAVVYPETTKDGWDYRPFSSVAKAYEAREEMYDSGNPLWPDESILVVNLWKLEDQK